MGALEKMSCTFIPRVANLTRINTYGYVKSLLKNLMFTDKSFEFTDVPRCDWPKGVCTYIDDPCPPDIPIDCRDEMHCPFSTNKCCCRYAI